MANSPHAGGSARYGSFRGFAPVRGSRRGAKGGTRTPRLAALEPRRGECRTRRYPSAPQRAWRLAGVNGQQPASEGARLATARSADSRPFAGRGLVRKGGLEPPRLAALEPKSRASTNSATFARCEILRRSQPPSPCYRPERAAARPLPPPVFDQRKRPACRAYRDLVGRQGFEPWTY